MFELGFRAGFELNFRAGFRVGLDFRVGFSTWIFQLDFSSRSYLRLRSGYQSDQAVFIQVNLYFLPFSYGQTGC